MSKKYLKLLIRFEKAERKNKDVRQYDGYRLRFTGKTKSEWGKLLKEYECSAGHKYWATN